MTVTNKTQLTARKIADKTSYRISSLLHLVCLLSYPTYILIQVKLAFAVNFLRCHYVSKTGIYRIKIAESSTVQTDKRRVQEVAKCKIWNHGFKLQAICISRGKQVNKNSLALWKSLLTLFCILTTSACPPKKAKLATQQQNATFMILTNSARTEAYD